MFPPMRKGEGASQLGGEGIPSQSCGVPKNMFKFAGWEEERRGPTGKSFRFVRAYGDCQVEMSLKRDPPRSPFRFSGRNVFPFPLGSSPSS